MSTFNGRVSEFPDIRIDFFRPHGDAQPPLACFLSHVHSDHLAGLESLRSPFVYCSAATREILLRLERYPCRINYAKGILEARQQTYKHLSKVLKPLPLETPAVLELRPGQHIQVTLLDANHCPGAVMFLIEGDGKAILYTGDIRSEPWHVNSLARSPSLIEYTSGIKTLDKLYLDTSFTDDVPFQTKADGLAELLRKVAQYPADTVFHFQAWTYGYEDVWVALSRFLKSPVHVDNYKMQIYRSLKTRASDSRFSADLHLTPEAPALTGYMCGNSPHPGCLTSESGPGVRLHSCEKGNMCAAARHPSVVQIQPIIAHLPGGTDLAEIGVGGGGDDLEREAELDVLYSDSLLTLLELIASAEEVPEHTRADLQRFLAQTFESGRNLALDLDISSFGEELSTSLGRAVQSITNKSIGAARSPAAGSHSTGDLLPKTIRFPYSRHSSYPELCHLASVFRPKDIWPCTVEPELWLKDGITIRSLFGKHCSGQLFEYDLELEALAERRTEQLSGSQSQQQDTQRSGHSVINLYSSPAAEPFSDDVCAAPMDNGITSAYSSVKEALVSPLPETQRRHGAEIPADMDTDMDATFTDDRVVQGLQAETQGTRSALLAQKRTFDEFVDAYEPTEQGDSQGTQKSITSGLSMRHSLARREAYYQMLENATTDHWSSIELLSTDNNHTVMDQEL